MGKTIKKLSAFFLAIVIIAGYVVPTNNVYAAAASASGSASMRYRTMFSDAAGKATVNLKITGTAGSYNRTIPNDIVVICDDSGSMSINDKVGTLKGAVTQFITKVSLVQHRIGLVSFGDKVFINKSFTTDKSELNSEVATLNARGSSTYVAPAIDAAVSMLKSDRRDNAKPTIILLTDGQAHDSQAMLEAAERAKAQGFIFYTIALLDDSNSSATNDAINNQLKRLATTAEHHHFVGVNNLGELYNALAEDIGVENPYNVEVKQVISDKFEYIEGSSDDNIPAPTVDGNTLTWNMLEIKNATIPLSYSIRPKDGSVEVGTYKVCSSSYLTYESYDGTEYLVTIPSPSVEVIDYVEPTIISMDPSSSNEGVKTSVVVKHKDFVYDDDFEVLANNNPMSVTYKGDDYFRFTVPSSMKAGKYAVKIGNHGGYLSGGTYTVIGPDVKPVSVGKIDVTSGDEGVKTLEKVTIANIGKDKYDVSVSINGANYAATYTCKDYFKFYMPTNLKAGSYPITATIEGGNYDLGTYTVKGEEVPELKFGELPVKETISGKYVDEKVTVSPKPNYTKGFTVKVGTTDCSVTYKGDSYFKFRIPASVTEGTYDVVVNYAGKATNIGTFEVKGEEIKVPQFGSLSVKSGKVGEKTAEIVKVTGLEKYPADFRIIVNGMAIEPNYKCETYFRFYIPTSLAAGTYDVKALFNGQEYKFDEYEVVGEEPKELEFGSLSPTEGEIGEVVGQKITVSEKPDYSSFVVSVGGNNVSLTYKGDTYFRFNIPGNLDPDTYEVKVTYSGKDKVIGTYTVKAPVVLEPEFGGLSVQEGLQTEAVKEVVNVSNVTAYPQDFAILVDGNPYSPTYKCEAYFRFTIPSGLSIGAHTVEALFGGKTYEIGTYTVKEEEIPDITYGELPSKEGVPGQSVEEKVTISEKIDYTKGFSVSIDGNNCSIDYKGDAYFRFTIPGNLSAGEYDVIANYRGAEKTIGVFTVKEPVVEEPEFGELPVTSGYTTSSSEEKVTVSNLKYASDFAIIIDGQSYEASYKCNDYFRFSIPKGLAGGTYEIKVINNGTEYSIGTYEAKVYTTPMFEASSIKTVSKGYVEVYVKNFNYKASPFKVYVGGNSVSIKYKGDKYFRIDPSGNKGPITVDYYDYTDEYIGFDIN